MMPKVDLAALAENEGNTNARTGFRVTCDGVHIAQLEASVGHGRHGFACNSDGVAPTRGKNEDQESRGL